MNRSKYAEIGQKMRAIPLERSYMSYEWEELVQRMCASDDRGLQGIGMRELECIRLKRRALDPYYC